ncbi:protein MAIN-LIKE 2-like [Coffea arabica]|uniref:Protein MAIN-LIKE 2-like n=1 Tax=Coffea arabica TaxID=13443 RepID=A0ABM4W655_COFAR
MERVAMRRLSSLGITYAGYFEIDHGLITMFIERWKQETHTFHLLVGEAIVALQDEEVLWGVRVDGLPVTLIDRNRNIIRKKQLIEELLSFRPETQNFKDGMLKLIPIFDFLYEPLPDDTLEELVQQHVRCYILILFAG